MKKILITFSILVVVYVACILKYMVINGYSLNTSFLVTNSLIEMPYRMYKKRGMEAEYKKIEEERKKIFFDEIKNNNETYLELFSGNIIRENMDYPNEISVEHILEILKEAEKRNIITPLYYYSLYSTKYLSNEENVKNPLYDLDKAWSVIEQAAYAGNQNAQNLLSHYYEYGEVFGYKTTPDPIEGLAWKVNVLFQDQSDVTINYIDLNKEIFIEKEAARLQISDIDHLQERIKEILANYPITQFITIKSFKDEKFDNHKKMLIKESSENDKEAMIVYAEYLYSGSFEFKDDDGAYYLYQKMLNEKDAESYLNLSMFYQTAGDEFRGFNPYYNPALALQYLEKAGMLGSNGASLYLGGLYTRGDAMHLEVEPDIALGAGWYIIHLLRSDGDLGFGGTFENQLASLTTDNEKRKAMKLVNEYRILHNIPNKYDLN